MKLHYSATSPYVRKVLVCAAERGLREGIELIDTKTGDPESGLRTDNPLDKVPTLITDDGMALYDSPVICEYLDHLPGGLADAPGLFPPAGADRWRALRLQALADGLLDAALACVMEGRRSENERSAGFVELQKGKINRALDAMGGDKSAFAGSLHIGVITVGCALGYLDLRFADDDWRQDRAALAAWFEEFSKRPSMTGTMPPA
ncbi:MAG: glutathione S-transferase N-terminal domain-containing protein [Proteobacteria bacterium]|nr:glutathione S-transferase N-terminal domain-containing protein [Pseudomonadota bacterium]